MEGTGDAFLSHALKAAAAALKGAMSGAAEQCGYP